MVEKIINTKKKDFTVISQQIPDDAVMTSIELLEQINMFRGQEGNRSELRHDTLRAIIKDEFEDEIVSQKILEKPIASNGGRPLSVFVLTYSQAKQVLVRESKFVRKAVIAYIDRLENALRQQKEPQLPTTYLDALKALVASEEEKERLTKEKKQAELRAVASEAHVSRLIHDKKTYTTTEIAKELGFKSATAFNKALKEKGVQYLLNKTWILYSPYSDKDYTSQKQIVLENGKVIYDRRWTGKGRDFLIGIFTDNIPECKVKVFHDLYEFFEAGFSGKVMIGYLI